MGEFKYSDEELKLNKVLKMNQDRSKALLNDVDMKETREAADENIGTSLALLRSLGRDGSIAQPAAGERRLTHRPQLESWDAITREAEEYTPGCVELEDIMSPAEIDAAAQELDEINAAFGKRTSIINKTDLSFLVIATALKVTKSLIFPYIAKNFHYGEGIDKAQRLAHNDQMIKDVQDSSAGVFEVKNRKKHGEGRWLEILSQAPPYDITVGSKNIGANMGGKYHRMYTLGHDPILGWLFGTMNILTDVVTLNDFRSYRVARDPMRIKRKRVSIGEMASESYQWTKADFLNLPTAVFVQAQHLKSDEYTKLGLPVPILSSFNENFASKLYRSNYDALCFARDIKIVGASFVVSRLFDIIIALTHGLFCPEDEPKELYEVRTRKLLIISDSIASSSTIIQTAITENPKNLDIGGLLNTVVHLFMDLRFIARIKREYIESEISQRLQAELDEVDKCYDTM